MYVKVKLSFIKKKIDFLSFLFFAKVRRKCPVLKFQAKRYSENLSSCSSKMLNIFKDFNCSLPKKI